MESKISLGEDKKKHKAGLLPHYFKKIGMVLLIMAFIPAIIVKYIGIELAQASKEVFKILLMNIVILSLLLVAFAKDKVEDEKTIFFRVKSLTIAFIWAVLFVVLKPLTDVIFKNKIENENAQGLVLSMLFVYLIFYYLQKRVSQSDF